MGALMNFSGYGKYISVIPLKNIFLSFGEVGESEFFSPVFGFCNIISRGDWEIGLVFVRTTS